MRPMTDEEWKDLYNNGRSLCRWGMSPFDRLKWVAISVALAAIYTALLVLPEKKR